MMNSGVLSNRFWKHKGAALTAYSHVKKNHFDVIAIGFIRGS